MPSVRNQSSADWLTERFERLTTELHIATPSSWAEEKRYLPPSVTNMPGPYRFEVAPFLREIVDCLGVESPVREVAVMKGAQVCATVGLIENAIGYYIEHVKTAPMMLVTADAQMAKLRIDSYVLPMLQHSGLDELIASNDEKNRRKTGKSGTKLEFVGGGFLLGTGAKNPTRGRSASIRILLGDETDGWPIVIGKDGDPVKIFEARTNAYEDAKKIFHGSTPLLEETSHILKLFRRGDQRHYYVCCLRCAFPQSLRFRPAPSEVGLVYGLQWELEQGLIVPDSVRYLCQNCQHEHFNSDKIRLLSPDHGAQWRPTATPVAPFVRSYHLPALLSPVGMLSWESIAQQWHEAWDDGANRPRDVQKLQTFYNNVLAQPFKMLGDRLTVEAVSSHRRSFYRYGQIPNAAATEFASSPILFLTCAVDVHGDNLAVGVFGWAREGRAFLVDYWRFEGDPSNLEDEPTWGRLQRFLSDPQYVSDDGRKYPLLLTLVDSGYDGDTVYRFCAQFPSGVYPLQGRDAPPARGRKEFTAFTTSLGTTAYGVTVNIYKERWFNRLRVQWSGSGSMPEWFVSVPEDATPKQIKELTNEWRAKKVDARTGQVLGWEWHRTKGVANELWDLLIYNTAAAEMVAANVCLEQYGAESVDWAAFWNFLSHQQPFSFAA